MRYYKIPTIVRHAYPKRVWTKQNEEKTIYLTFDDGPHPEVTPWVMEVLEGAEAKATFFCVGQKLRDHHDIAQKLISKGHSLANHTFNHLNGWKTTTDDYIKDVRYCDQELDKLGVSTHLFRPPYGKIRKKQVKNLIDKKIIMWSHLAWDFDPNLNTNKSLKQLKKASPGSILTFHDSLAAFPNLKKILPELMMYFKDRNFQFNVIKG